MKKRYSFLSKVGACIAAISVLLCFQCSNKTPQKTSAAPEAPKIIISGKPADMAKYYKSPEFQECYKEPILPPPLTLDTNLSAKSLQELRLLRNEIYARHGYLFMDMVLRGYFVQYKWYQPIYWDSLYNVTLSADEAAYVEKISALEKERLKDNFVEVDGRRMSNYRNVVNTIQFNEIPDTLGSLLTKNGFALVKSDRQQLFHVYDENQYEAIPHYVTVDLYVQLLHIFYSNLLRKLESDKLVPALRKALDQLQSRSIELYAKCKTGNKFLENAARFNVMYYSVAKATLEDSAGNVPGDVREELEKELSRVNSRNGRGSPFLKSEFFDYSQLQPRGYYASDSSLCAYFECFRWLELAPMFVSDDDGVASAIVGAYLLSQDGQVIPQYRAIDGVASVLVGRPNNLSLTDVVPLIQGANSPEKLATFFTPEKLEEIKGKLLSMDHARIVNRGASEPAQKEFAKVPLHFMSARYTFDGEILQRLVDVLRPEPKRPFPKGLDVFAVFGNKEAERILLDTYQEAKVWPAYQDSLAVLKKTFSVFGGWNENAYNKRMQTVLSFLDVEPSFPPYMQTAEWQRRSLNTALAGWTHLKHETVLYTFPPGGAECGEGGCAPPPNPIGYVEPNISFWKNALDLIDLTTKGLKDVGCESGSAADLGGEISESISLMKSISEKELSGVALTPKEFNEIHFIGGKIEKLTLEALNAQTIDDSPDRRMPVATDVYTFNSTCLQEATGLGNDIYVIVEINGYLYIARGAVLSYYEFLHSTNGRLTDKEWQEQLKDGKSPPAPVWLNDLFAPIQKLETKPTYNSLLPSGC
jgi:hypothetical protein